MAEGSGSTHQREAKRARLPQFREARPKRTTHTSSIVSLQRGSAGNLKARERGRQRQALAKEPIPDEDTFPTQELSTPPSELATEAPPKLKRKRVNTTKVSSSHFVELYLTIHLLQSRLLEWVDLRDSCLDELLRHDGPLDLPSGCTRCPARDELFQCKDCGHGQSLLCAGCMVGKHGEQELHRVEASKDLLNVVVFF